MIYFDNNATTIMPSCVMKKMQEYMNKGNPSADYRTAKECREMMDEIREFIATNCKFRAYKAGKKYDSTGSREKALVYRIIFTSCASESNNTVIKSICDSYAFATKRIPHVIMSSVEHKSSLLCVDQLAQFGRIEVTLIKPATSGHVNPAHVEAAIRPNTCLISIMHANNETGAINDIRKIGEIAHAHNIPFHSDCVQTFGKFRINPIDNNIDAISVSFHKLHGPPGVGALIIKNALVEGYHLCADICGTQNCGLRGGTENIIGIAGAFEATKYTWADRYQKNNRMFLLKKTIVAKLAQDFPCQYYTEYINTPLNYNLFIVLISGVDEHYLPNTLLLSVVKKSAPYVCNGKIKKALEKSGIIVSIGSACNTASNSASHVLADADAFIKRGTLRISLGDHNTAEEIDKFCEVFTQILNKCAKK